MPRTTDTEPATTSMGLTCNIDRRGRAVRAVGGAVALALSAFGGALVWLADLGLWGWAATATIAAFGVLGLFEAANGWCAVRAMGFRTRL